MTMQPHRKYEDRTCVQCGNKFAARKDKATKYCSRTCFSHSRKPKTKICPVCNVEFVAKIKARIHCSNKCAAATRTKKVAMSCDNCGEEFYRSPSAVRSTHNLCSRSCLDVWNRENPQAKEKHHAWKGGVWISNGYRWLRQTDGSYKQEHRIVAEEMLGRPLEDDEIVHHINEDKLDNHPANLQVMLRADHILLHNPHCWQIAV